MTKTHVPSLGVGIILGAILITGWTTTSSNTDTTFANRLDLGLDPVVPVRIIYSGNAQGETLTELLIEPEDPRMLGLNGWLTGLAADTYKSDTTPPHHFSLDHWMDNPTPNTIILFAEHDDYQNVILIQKWTVTHFILHQTKTSTTTEGYIEKYAWRNPGQELMMLMSPEGTNRLDAETAAIN